METYRKDKALNIMSRLFYCDITDRLPCFLYLKFEKYRKISNIRRTKYLNLNDSPLVLQLSVPNPLKLCVEWGNEDVIGAPPTGDAPTTSE